MIPPYIINKKKDDEVGQQIQLEIPDYTLEYQIWKEKKDKENNENSEDTIIIIDIY